jgi:hypothetical protein
MCNIKNTVYLHIKLTLPKKKVLNLEHLAFSFNVCGR